MKEVTEGRYAEVLKEHQGDEYYLILKGWQVPILHGLVALAADHPSMKEMHEPTHSVIREVRDWAKDIFAHWGFTPEEVEYLDKMREEYREGDQLPAKTPFDYLQSTINGFSLADAYKQGWRHGRR